MAVPMDKVYRTKNYVNNNKVLSTKTGAIKMVILTDKVHRIKNRVNNNKVLSTKT